MSRHRLYEAAWRAEPWAVLGMGRGPARRALGRIAGVRPGGESHWGGMGEGQVPLGEHPAYQTGRYGAGARARSTSVTSPSLLPRVRGRLVV